MSKTLEENGFTWVPTTEGWFSSGCPDWAVELAKQRHIDENKKFSEDNYIEQAASDDGEDTRWSGRLGEIALNSFLTLRGIPFEWAALASPTGEDFLIREIKTDLKTKAVGGYPKLSNTFYATVPDKQWGRIRDSDDIKECDYFLFNSFNYKLNHMYILGGMSVEEFYHLSVPREVGDVVHAFYTVKERSWDVLLSDLKVPCDWT